ncbi:MAG TPA: D-alanyl-D-alanine carboxypeptidase family protein [Clostridia bacterium]|nr:D-alanyl-D-alanine carboxypeptidase family protein [Clostridia bacterium]
MTKQKRFVFLIICLMLITSSTVNFASDTIDEDYSITKDDIFSEGAILINASTGQILFEKNPHKRLYPASTTKILTALLIEEKFNLDDKVTIDPESPFTIGARIYVHEGEIFTIEQLLNALLIDSANDVANALAVYHSGSLEAFSKEMNEKAKSLGAQNSNFVNPSGLHNSDHYSTAFDLSQIAKEFYKNEVLMAIVKKSTYSIPATNKVDETRYLKSSNKFLYSESNNYLLDYRGNQVFAKLDSVTGMKTGYTDEANNCLITSAVDEDKELISVILNATGRHSYTDSRKLIEFGFYEFIIKNYFEKNEVVKDIEINNFKKSKISLLAQEDVNILLNKNYDSNKLTTESIIKDITLPIEKNSVVGEFNIYYDEQLISSSPLISNITVSNALLLNEETNYFSEENSINYMSILGIFLKLLLAFILWRSIITLIRLKFEN